MDKLDVLNKFIIHYRNLVYSQGQNWYDPVIGAPEYDPNEPEASWSRVDKALILSVLDSGEIECLEVRGPNMVSDMDELINPTDDQLIKWWEWLYPKTESIKTNELTDSVSAIEECRAGRMAELCPDLVDDYDIQS